MRAADPSLQRRADFRAASGVLLVLRDPPPAPPPAPGNPPIVAGNPAEGPEVLLAVWDDGSATALHGHVDLGTGLRTALGQLVAEELDLPMARVHVVLGDTARAPNQGPTIASASIQIHGAPLRAAAAQARAWLSAQGGFGALAGQHVELTLDLATPLKAVAEHRVVGQPVARVDIPAKVSGEPIYVHDVRVPGMLHGRVVRPPYAGLDAGDFVGRTLEAVDESSVAHVPGLRAVVTQGDFVGVVAEREEHAEKAMRALRVRWKDFPAAPSVQDLAAALSANPATERVVAERGDVAGTLAAGGAMERRYVWPYQLHASIGPSCAVAHWRGDALTVWAGTQNPHVLRADLAKLTGLADTAIDVVRLEASGCYGRNGADDVAADAALLSRAVGAPVRVQLTREQETLWEPKGAAQLMDVKGALGPDGRLAAYDFTTAYPSNGAPTLALLLTRTVEPVAQAFLMGDRTSVPPYETGALKVTVRDMAPILRASWLRGVAALPNSFAHESFADEAALAAGRDPVEFRLAHLKDDRAAELLRATADKAGWVPHVQPRQKPAQGDWLQGQGVAYARYVHSKFPGFAAAYSAWVADVEVHRDTGEVHVKRVVVGHDAGLVVNPAGVEHQVHGNVLQTTSRALKENVRTEATRGTVATREWGSYPILSFREVPVIEVLQMPRPGEPPLGAGESSSVPGTAAIANAIFDATGVRFRQPPFTPEVVRAALQAPAQDAPPSAPPPAAQPSGVRPAVRRKGLLASSAALAVGALSALAGLAGWRPAIAPVSHQAQAYSAATVERGRQLVALGGCEICHTAEGGIPWAGGRPVVTPFGTVYTTNLTPDAETGLGRWSFTAFQRAMREGLSRDGRHLFPAFPYTAFTRASDDDLLAIYAYLGTLPATQARTPEPEMRGPFGWRPLLALWNALFLSPGPLPTDPARSALWNRGAYLAESLGHCSACHTPRGAFGQELAGQHHAGAWVDGWEAPSLTAASRAPIAWSENSLFDYLRQGFSREHGSASGPMAPLVVQWSALPDDDLRAIAHYVASLQRPAVAASAAEVVARARAVAPAPDAAARLFQGACGACHHEGEGPLTFGPNVPLALNSNLHADRPDNLLRVILHGVGEPAPRATGPMPAFRDALDDAQVAELVAWMRRRFAPGREPWSGLPEAAARIRAGK